MRAGGDPDLVAVLRQALAATARSTDRLTHPFHAYPARMHPEIARVVLGAWAEPRDVVLDPFCGGGTVLLEAMVAGSKPIGVDLNPVALRIAEVRCRRTSAQDRARFERSLRAVAERSRARVKARAPSRAPLPASEVRFYQPHVLKELAGIQAEIQEVCPDADRRALEVVLSAIVVKFSRQRADTSERLVNKRIGKYIVTDFFERKGLELVARWEALDAACGPETFRPRLLGGDARRLGDLLGAARADLVLTSPPYGGTNDYAAHHRRRYRWLGLSGRALEEGEIGARRHLSAGGADAERRWDDELGAALGAMASVLCPGGRCVLVIGDASLGDVRLDAGEQVRALAGRAGLRVRAGAAQERTDWLGGPPRWEHLIVLDHA